MNANDTASMGNILRQLFGDNRAEWTTARFREYFVAPAYLQKLESTRPCILVGGRGTGKTTSLQSLRYDSCLERLEGAGQGFGDQEYVGILVRMNKNRVHAFQGVQLNDSQWAKLFGHYFNLLVCFEMAGLALWLEKKTVQTFPSKSVLKLSQELGLAQVASLNELRDAIQSAIVGLELQVNNPTRDLGIALSIAEGPVRSFAEELERQGLLGNRIIFCCVDEYENLLDSQQAIVNTYIKHAEPPLSYKIGVRKNGLRNRQTLDGDDLLKTPDDYAEIEIAEEGFDYFAQAVADLRLKRAKEQNVPVPYNLADFLQDLTFSEEALLLGADKVADKVLEEIREADLDLYGFFKDKPKSETYFLQYWAESDASTTLISLARDWRRNEREWATRIGNYGFASLFWLSRGNKGARIRKYYCGQRVFLSLAGGNIRYFLELIDTAIAHELDSQRDRFVTVISPKSQTLAARDVGLRRLNQVEGLADHGVQLKRLVLAIGKVFFELARTPNGRAPEVTSFVLSGHEQDLMKIHALLSEGVGHLAFEVAPRTKPTSKLELRDDEYRLHRIFSAFFEISHRKKRRTTFDASDLLSVFDDRPSSAISSLLENRAQSAEDELPEQLAFFSAFYDGTAKN